MVNRRRRTGSNSMCSALAEQTTQQIAVASLHLLHVNYGPQLPNDATRLEILEPRPRSARCGDMDTGYGAIRRNCQPNLRPRVCSRACMSIPTSPRALEYPGLLSIDNADTQTLGTTSTSSNKHVFRTRQANDAIPPV